MQDCTAFAATLPTCPTGTTQGDPGAGTCVSRVAQVSGDNCVVRGFEASAAQCDAGGTGGTGGGTTGQGCMDECGEPRRDGEKWCTAGTTSLGMRTSQCTNGSVNYTSTISGIGCDAGGRYQCN